jgi:hypothetical protein
MAHSNSPSIFQFRHGDHLCVFHRSEDHLMEILSPYIAEGLRKGERCFCVQKPEIVKRLDRDLQFLGINTEKAVKSGSLEFHNLSEAYLPSGRFEPAGMIEMLVRSIEESMKKGFSGFRIAGDLSWAVDGRDECRQIIGYEAMVEECFPGKPAIGLCQYPINSFPPAVLQSVMNAHRQRIVQPETPSLCASLSISGDHYITEFVADKFVVNPKYYYVVDQQDGRNILGWGIASDFDLATSQAETLIRRRSAPTYRN